MHNLYKVKIRHCESDAIINFEISVYWTELGDGLWVRNMGEVYNKCNSFIRENIRSHKKWIITEISEIAEG